MEEGEGGTVGLARPPASASPMSRIRVAPTSSRRTRVFSLKLPWLAASACRKVMDALLPSWTGEFSMREDRLTCSVAAGRFWPRHCLGPKA
jgi:hypothetical protein